MAKLTICNCIVQENSKGIVDCFGTISEEEINFNISQSNTDKTIDKASTLITYFCGMNYG